MTEALEALDPRSMYSQAGFRSRATPLCSTSRQATRWSMRWSLPTETSAGSLHSICIYPLRRRHPALTRGEDRSRPRGPVGLLFPASLDCAARAGHRPAAGRRRAPDPTIPFGGRDALRGRAHGWLPRTGWRSPAPGPDLRAGDCRPGGEDRHPQHRAFPGRRDPTQAVKVLVVVEATGGVTVAEPIAHLSCLRRRQHGQRLVHDQC